MIEKIEVNLLDTIMFPGNKLLTDKLNEVIETLNKISSLERLEKDLKELGGAFDKVECQHDWYLPTETTTYACYICRKCGASKPL